MFGFVDVEVITYHAIELTSNSMLLYKLLTEQMRCRCVVEFPVVEHFRKLFYHKDTAQNRYDERIAKQFNPGVMEGISDASCIRFGQGHNHVATAHGFYSWGDNRRNQIGDGFIGSESDNPVENQSLKGKVIRHIACSYSHVLVVTDAGTVYVWGSSLGSALLGLGPEVQICHHPTAINNLPPIRRVYSGESSCFSFALSKHGDLYCWGQNHSGQLGLGDNIPRSSPVIVKPINKVSLLSVGTNYVYAVDFERRVYAWGDNQHQQCLGVQTKPTNILVPTEITELRNKNIVDIHCTKECVLMISEDGDVYGWNFESVYGPKIDYRLFRKLKIKSVSSSLYLMIVTTKDDETYTSGDYRVPWVAADPSSNGLYKINIASGFKVVAGWAIPFVLSDSRDAVMDPINVQQNNNRTFAQRGVGILNRIRRRFAWV
ncbi:hypothetical protein AKO1_003475 [Acrasis kona]|uniref:Uncharacterized protein n=1 Tax=Acrasis kona TaxID=1008807 RepID=A0AAW2Z5A7_9EUKA